MANETPNYHLKKPLQEDFYDVEVQNANMDTIDAELKGLEDGKVAKVNGKQLSTNDFTTTEKTKLEGLQNYDDTAVKQSVTEAVTDSKAYTDTKTGTKVDKVAGKDLSSNDFSDAEKLKLQGIAAAAQENVIEKARVNGTLLVPDASKTINITIPAAIPIVNTLTSTSTTSALSAAQGKVLKDLADGHIATGINTAAGVHGLRFYQDTLSFFNGSSWVEIETGSSGIIPGDLIEISIQSGNAQMKINFTEPDDSSWIGTKVVRKAGAYPESVKDGVQVLDNKVKNRYKDTAFIDSGLTNGTTYYYQFFTYSTSGGVNMNGVNRADGMPQPFKIMTVKIDLGNSNPASCCTYGEDALTMTPGSSAWDDFFGEKPCLLKNGVNVGYLNPNDFTKFADGRTADITSGNAGDVMIEFPRRGLTMNTVGNILTIRMTDNPDDPNFKYYAHQRGTAKKTNFYLGAYKGVQESSKLRSLSGKTPTDTQTIGTFRTYARVNGAGYDQSGFYQLIFRQCMFVLKYKELNSQLKIGMGNVSSLKSTGATNTRGMTWGSTSTAEQMKLFGIEDFWGNIFEWIDGIATDASFNMFTNTSNFQDDGKGSGYMNNGQGVTSNTGGWMSKPQGKTETGFLAKEVGGSETTYFSDSASLYGGCVAYFGGHWGNSSAAGTFSLYVSYSASGSYANVGGRLMFL